MLYLFTNIFVTTSLQDINNKYSGWSIYFQENNISFKDISIIISTDVNVQYIYDNKNNYSVVLRPMSIISLKSLGEQLNSIVDKFQEDIKEKAVKYIHQ